MKSNDLYKKIRKIYMRHLIWPIFPIAISLIFGIIIPFKEMLNPVRVYSLDEAIDAVKNGHEYIEININKLFYSGYSYMKDKDVFGEYYYNLSDKERCVFFLLRPEDKGETLRTIENVSKTVKVVETNGIFDNMLSMFSNTINWTEEGVKNITESYVLSEVDYHGIVYTVLFIIMCIVFVYGMTIFIYNLIFTSLPMFSPKLVVAKYYFKYDKMIKKQSMDDFMNIVAREMEEPKVQQNEMYITEHFFINMDKSDFAIVPINKIILAYEHSTLKSFWGMHLKVSYTLYLKCSTTLRFSAPKKNHDEVNSILDYFKENKPNILVGYTDENKQLVKELISKSTGWLKK